MMKFLKLLSVFLITGIIFSACQKEYDIIDGIATGTLKEDASGDCMPVTINGIYTANAVLGTGNFADIQVNIDNIGTYDITTDTVNGYFFHGAASVAITGINTIRLQAAGKPIISGTDIFRVKFSGTMCELNVSVVTGASSAAVFTLAAAATGAACTGALQSGAYNQGLATSASNTVTVFANVTTAGSYTISTTTVNGVSFSGSGILAAGTSQQIVLTANGGTPTAAGTFNYPVTAGASSCNFDVIYGAPLPPATITANCSGVTANGTYQAGTALNSSNTILVPVTVATPGTYTITTASQNGVSFSGSGVVTAGSTSIILSASATTPTAAGTFAYPLVINGAASCSVSVTYSAAPTAGGTFSANINGGALTTFQVNVDVDTNPFLGAPSISITGDNNGTGSESLNFSVTDPAGISTTATYSTAGAAAFVDADYVDAAGTDYIAGNGSGNPSPFLIRFTSFTANTVTGTFSGLVKEPGGASKTFTNGTFNLHY